MAPLFTQIFIYNLGLSDYSKMANKVEMFVRLVIPDTTAITAFHAIERMGYRAGKLQRYDYYSFSFTGDIEKFKEQISNVDVLVNANKHRHSFEIEDKESAKVLVKDIDNGAKGILSTLNNRLGFKNIVSMEKGTLWLMDTDEKTAREIAEKLLYNKHYQKAEIYR